MSDVPVHARRGTGGRSDAATPFDPVRFAALQLARLRALGASADLALRLSGERLRGLAERPSTGVVSRRGGPSSRRWRVSDRVIRGWRQVAEAGDRAARCGAAERFVDALAALWEALLAGARPDDGAGAGGRAARRGARAQGGTFYTPALLSERLVSDAFGALDAVAPDVRDARVIDPAVGAGSLLCAAAERLLARQRVPDSGEPEEALRMRIATTQLYGIDVDPVGLALCRMRLEAWSRGGASWRPSGLMRTSGALVEADALLGPGREEGSTGCLALRDDSAPGIDWQARWPEVAARGGFDVVVTNPPFVNAVEGGMSRQRKRVLGLRHPVLRQTADLAYYFVPRSLELVHARGVVSLVLPRAFLNALSAERLRASLTGPMWPSAIRLVTAHTHFRAASVFVCLLTVSARPTCAVSVDDGGSVAGVIAGANWWAEVQRVIGGRAAPVDDPAVGRLGDVFEVRGGLGLADVYVVKPWVRDEASGEGPALVTTGLIDPGVCHWGTRPCRFLRDDYLHPRVGEGPAYGAALRRILAQSRRPKVLVAGLSRVVECFVDVEGRYVGSVATWSIFHPADDVSALEAVAAYLSTPEVTRRFREEMGGNAMGGGNTTMKPSFLASLPWPA